MKKKIFLAIVLLLVVGIVWLATREKQVPNTPINEAAGTVYYNASDNLIKVELPFPGAATGKEFTVIGEARGYWFFEASFPIELLDKNGARLAMAVAQAQPDRATGEINWMTEDFVPFRADIKVGFDWRGEPIAGADADYIGVATLVLHKDNPSGLAENTAFVSFPIIVEY